MSWLNRTTAAKPARVLVASGRRIDLTATATAGPQRSNKLRPWQEDAWAYRDAIGEINYAMRFLKYACSKVRLTVAVANADGEEPTPIDDAEGIDAGAKAAALDALARLSGGTFQYGQMLSTYAENLEVPGECMLVGRSVDGAEAWDIYSIDEVQRNGGTWRLVSSANDKQGELLDPATSYVARLWTPHPRWHRQADSPMRALLETCEELQLVSAMIRRTSRSRIASNGILGIATEIDFSGGPDDPGDVDGDPFQAELQRAMLTAVSDEAAPEALLPIVVRAPAEMLDKGIKHIAIANTADEKLMDRVDKALARLGTGLDVPPEILTGMADVNHWTAWQIDDSTFENHVEPLVVRMVDGLTAGYLRPVLAEYGVDPATAARVVFWFDPSDLVVKPNRGDDAKAGHAANVLSDVALVEALGFNPATDMPSEDELARRLALVRGQVDAPLTEALMRLLMLTQLPEVVRGSTSGTGGSTGGDGEDAGDSTGDEGPPPAVNASAAVPAAPVLHAYTRLSRRLTDVDRALRDRLAAGMDAAVRRAVERAANRVRSAANKDRAARAAISAVPARQAAAHLGRDQVAAFGLDDGQLLAGAWDDLLEQWARWLAPAQAEAIATAVKIAGVDPEDPAVASQVRVLQTHLDSHASTAAAWLLGALDRLALDLVYDPASVDDTKEAGEEPGLPGRLSTLARGALALAGGIPATSAGVTADGVAAEPGTRVTGLATGDVIDQFLRGAGTEVIGYEWVYGISVRHFPPHYALDGTTFAQFGDPVLDNPDGWPAATCAPGDHRGCHCDAAPIYADGLNSSAGLAAVGDATYDSSYLDVLRRIASDDLAAGRTDTSAVRTVREADQVAASRPSGRK